MKWTELIWRPVVWFFITTINIRVRQFAGTFFRGQASVRFQGLNSMSEMGVSLQLGNFVTIFALYSRDRLPLESLAVL